jgi:hypothetical protein
MPLLHKRSVELPGSMKQEFSQLGAKLVPGLSNLGKLLGTMVGKGSIQKLGEIYSDPIISTA